MEGAILSTASLKKGAFFYASADHGGTAICLVTSIRTGTIYARRITTNEKLVFNANDGIGVSKRANSNWQIVTTEQPPDEVIEIYKGIDRKYSFLDAPDGFRLTIDEKRALLFAAEYHGLNLDDHDADLLTAIRNNFLYRKVESAI